MRAFVSGLLVAIGAVSLATARAAAMTGRGDDMCKQPTMKTDKWQLRQAVGGMTILLPPGYVESGKSSDLNLLDSHYYINGEHRAIGVGSGQGPAFLRNSNVSESGECETAIADRRVTITVYHWVNEDARLSASGDAGAHFAAIARFYATASLREVYVEIFSNAPSDLKYFRQLFWTVTFPDGVASAASPATPAKLVADATAPASAAPAACAPTPGLPTTNALLDSSVVRMLLSSAGPVPHGYEILALQFAGSGELSGMSVAKSDLPDAAQHQLASVVATNLKPHDAHAPSTFLLRIDSANEGLSYTVLPVSGCSP